MRWYARHKVPARADLPEDALCHESVVLSVAGVGPVVDQAHHHGSALPPVVRTRQEPRCSTLCIAFSVTLGVFWGQGKTNSVVASIP